MKYDLKANPSRVAGYYNCSKGKIVAHYPKITEEDVKKQTQSVGKASSWKTKRIRKKILKNSLIGANDKIKSTIYHELGHLLETKSFMDKKFIKVGLTNETKTNTGESNNYESMYEGHDFDFRHDLRLNAISECMNEEFSQTINHNYEPKDKWDGELGGDRTVARKTKVNTEDFLKAVNEKLKELL